MTLLEFEKNHIQADWLTDKLKVINLVVLNAKAGGECMRMCGLFDIPPTSLMIPGGGGSSLIEEDNYVNFVADGNGNASSYIGDMYTPKGKTKTMYYPEIAEILDEIFDMYPEFIEQMPGGSNKDKEDSSALYRALGMEISDD